MSSPTDRQIQDILRRLDRIEKYLALTDAAGKSGFGENAPVRQATAPSSPNYGPSSPPDERCSTHLLANKHKKHCGS
jgi:hypothetical protein